MAKEAAGVTIPAFQLARQNVRRNLKEALEHVKDGKEGDDLAALAKSTWTCFEGQKE